MLIKPSSLGDVVDALPVLHGLRTRYPQAKIDWLISSAFTALLESHDELDEAVVFERVRFGRIGRSPRVTREFVGFLRHLRSRRYELVIDLQGLFRTAFLTWRTGAPVRIGFSPGREGASMFYTHRVRIDDFDTHAVDRNYRVAELLGFDHVPIRFNVPLQESHYDGARALLHAGGFAADEKLVVVVPGARWETKMWSPERFADTIDRLHTRPQVRCVLVGTAEEKALCERIVRLCRAAPVNLAGRTALPEFAALIGLADVVLCHDSAAMHLAVALGRPLVCLIGPTNPMRTGPYRRMNDVVGLKLDCSPCYLRRLSRCPYEHRCMRELDVGTVAAAARRALMASAGIPV